MTNLRSYWFFHDSVILFPSLASAKQFTHEAFREFGWNEIRNDPLIFHYVNDRVVSFVRIYCPDYKHLTFSRPHRL